MNQRIGALPVYVFLCFFCVFSLSLFASQINLKRIEVKGCWCLTQELCHLKTVVIRFLYLPTELFRTLNILHFRPHYICFLLLNFSMTCGKRCPFMIVKFIVGGQLGKGDHAVVSGGLVPFIFNLFKLGRC